MEKNSNEKELKTGVQEFMEQRSKYEPLRLNRFLVRTPKEACIIPWTIQRVRVTPSQIRIVVTCTLGGMSTRQEFIDYGCKFNDLTVNERIIVIEDLDAVGNVFVRATYTDCYFDHDRMYDTIQYDYANSECKTYEIVFTYDCKYEEKVGDVPQF